MSGTIYLRDEHGELKKMTQLDYDSEDVLQRLLARYPDLLAGEQIDSDRPRRWLLLGREVGLTDREDGADRWSVDHLFVDQEAVPTLVEVKRSADTRIRREVVGQMLDYAANAVTYWPTDRLRSVFEEQIRKRGGDPDRALTEFLGPDADASAFWSDLVTNLKEGRLRLLFVAEGIPSELRRIIEFLNDQMDRTEVLGVEIKRFTNEKTEVHVPRVIGQTARARQQKRTSRTSRVWDEASFFAEIARACSSEDVEFVRGLYDWAVERWGPPNWGTGTTRGSFMIRPEKYPLLIVRTDGVMQLWFAAMGWPPFDDHAERMRLIERFNVVPGVALEPTSTEGMGKIHVADVRFHTALPAFREALDWAASRIRESTSDR